MDASDRRKRASAEAADWFARLQAGAMECAEREQFVEWLRESHVHVAEMLRIEQIHGSLAHFEQWTRIHTGPKTAADEVVQLPPALEGSPRTSSGSALRGPLPRMRTGGHRLRILAIAAMIVLIAGAALVLPQVRGQAIQTERGERREVVLSDGSVLRVDPETLLRVKYTAAARLVFLEHGRALFRVAKNPNRPFLVHAGETTVRAVGTVFGVEQQTRGVVVTVADGKVAVISEAAASRFGSLPHSSSNASRRAGEGGEEAGAFPPVTGAAGVDSTRIGASAHRGSGTFFLTANQQMTVARSGPVEPVHEVDSRRALAWVEGRLIFQNDSVRHAVAEFNRYNRVQLTVTDPVLAAKPVSGVFNAAEPEAFIAFLQSVMPLEIERDADRSITIGAARRH